MVKYSNAQFTDDLEELRNMLNDTTSNYKLSGGKKETGEEIRWFKLVAVNGKNLPKHIGRYRAYTKKVVRSGKSKKLKEVNQTPLNAATRAFSQLCQKKGAGCKMQFTIRETTGGSSKKDYTYYGKKVKLAKKIIVKSPSGDYSVEFEHKVHKVSTNGK
jgi:hypothetical protein